MDFTRQYQRLLALTVAGEHEQEQEQTEAAALGRLLAERDVDYPELARIHAAALEDHLGSAPGDLRAMILLRASRCLAEVMMWRGVAGSLLEQKRWAEAQLSGVERVVAPADAPSAATGTRREFRHPLADASAFLERIAVTDPLTGIYNARHFHIALEAQVHAAQEAGRPLSLLLIDVDGLSRINEAFGHREGDDTLAALAKLLMANTRASDFVARCGGDEFAVMLPNCATRQALVMADRLRRVVEEQRLGDGLAVSVGVATFPTDAAGDRDLINVTQQACYLAQRLGGNTVCTALVAEPEVTSSPSGPTWSDAV